MTLLDRFRTSSRETSPDPAVRLAFVQELPMDQRDALAAFARDDEDPRVRRAAVAKLMDPALLSAAARGDADESVRAQATTMLRDIALEVFEGAGEAESVAAVQAVSDARTLAAIAKSAPREAVARLALQRVTDAHTLGSIARHAAQEPIRRDAFERLQDPGELLRVATHGEFKDTAAAAVDRFSDRADLEQIAARAKNKHAVKRARGLLREMDERAAQESAAAGEAASASLEPEDLVRVQQEASERHTADALAEARRHAEAAAADEAAGARRAAVSARTALCERLEQLSAEASLDAIQVARSEWEGMPALDDADQHAELARRLEAAARACERRHAEWIDAERRRGRLSELAQEAADVSAAEDLQAARRQMALIRREWADLSRGLTIDPAMAARYREADAALSVRDAAAHEHDQRARREALTRVTQLGDRLEALASRPDLSLKAAERALRDVRAALGTMPPLPSKKDYDEALRRLKASQAALTPKVQELREISDWQRWANIGIQEQLCEKMEALAALDDAEAVAQQIRELQQQWRLAADVPHAQGDVLWKRFKAAHDVAWQRCEAHFAAQAHVRAENLAKKVALCGRAESLAESTNWIQTADEIKRLQSEWKTIGPVSRGQEKAIWERFRSACDRFFTRRHADLAQRKTVWADNLAKKEALCVRAEALAESSDWDAASAGIKQLQAEWKSIGAVKKTRSDAIWQRFRGACDRFFARYAQRHDVARAERVAAREAVVRELESVVSLQSSVTSPESSVVSPESESSVTNPESSVVSPESESSVTNPESSVVSPEPPAPSLQPPADLLARVRDLRARYQHEVAARGVDRERATALDRRFAAAFAAIVARWPAVFSGTDLDPDSNRKKMESLVRRMEDLAASLAGRGAADQNLSPTTRLAAMLKEALASNTIGGKVDDDSRWRAAAEDVRQAQASWARIGPVPDEARRALAGRFDRAARTITDRTQRIGASVSSGQRARPTES
jgi:hypothetical protein